MICAYCSQTASRIRVVEGRTICGTCGGFSEAGGHRVDGVLARQRTRDQGVKFEGDTLNPWLYSKSEKAFVPNDDFIKLHGENSSNFYAPKDLKNYPKLVTKLRYQKQQSVGESGVQEIGNVSEAHQTLFAV